jgi:hypothetical protein
MCDAAGYEVEKISCKACHASSASRVKPASYSYHSRIAGPAVINLKNL